MQYDRHDDATATLSHVQFLFDTSKAQSPVCRPPEPHTNEFVGLLTEHLNEMTNVLIARRRLGLKLSDLKPQLRSMAYAVDLLYEVIEASEPNPEEYYRTSLEALKGAKNPERKTGKIGEGAQSGRFDKSKGEGE